MRGGMRSGAILAPRKWGSPISTEVAATAVSWRDLPEARRKLACHWRRNTPSRPGARHLCPSYAGFLLPQEMGLPHFYGSSTVATHAAISRSASSAT
jgi:hypothetical protein